MPPSPSDAIALIEPTLAGVRDAFRGEAPTLDFRFWRATSGLDAPRLDVWFFVETDAELQACERQGLRTRLDEETRMRLARQTRDVIMVALRSRESLDRSVADRRGW